jgi:hypothetical protein
MGSTEEQLIHARVIPEANPARTIMDDWHPRLFVPHELLLARAASSLLSAWQGMEKARVAHGPSLRSTQRRP